MWVWEVLGSVLPLSVEGFFRGSSSAVETEVEAELEVANEVSRGSGFASDKDFVVLD